MFPGKPQLSRLDVSLLFTNDILLWDGWGQCSGRGLFRIKVYSWFDLIFCTHYERKLFPNRVFRIDEVAKSGFNGLHPRPLFLYLSVVPAKRHTSDFGSEERSSYTLVSPSREKGERGDQWKRIKSVSFLRRGLTLSRNGKTWRLRCQMSCLATTFWVTFSVLTIPIY